MIAPFVAVIVRPVSSWPAGAAEKRAAGAESTAASANRPLTADDVRELLAQAGDVHRIIESTHLSDLALLYQKLGHSIVYDHADRVADVSIDPVVETGRTKVGVRGGICTLTTRIRLDDAD